MSKRINVEAILDKYFILIGITYYKKVRMKAAIEEIIEGVQFKINSAWRTTEWGKTVFTVVKVKNGLVTIGWPNKDGRTTVYGLKDVKWKFQLGDWIVYNTNTQNQK